MPTNRRRIKRGHKRAVSGEELEVHLFGYRMIDGRKPVFKTDKDRFASWRTHRDYIMSLQGQKVRGESFGLSGDAVYFDHGTRPASWWDFDAPEPRRLLSGDPSGAMPEHGYIKGVPRMFTTLEARQAMQYETEEAYLRRHGLLTDAETQYLENPNSTTRR